MFSSIIPNQKGGSRFSNDYHLFISLFYFFQPLQTSIRDLFPRSVKRGILEWILNAKRPETRAKRIEETVTLAEKNVRANQWRQ